ANQTCWAMSRARTRLTPTGVFSSPASIWSAVMRCSRAGRMDTAREFIALVTCGVWDRLLAERRPRKLSGLELICELSDEDRDRFGLLLAVGRGPFLSFDR